MRGLREPLAFDSMTAAICPWCSAELPSPALESCPSCGASLVPTAPDDLPGVTQVDLEALRRGPPIVQHPRGLLGLISGEYPVEEQVAPHSVLAPPPEDVRREMLRMEIAAAEAELAAAKAEADIAAADAAELAQAEAAAQAQAVVATTGDVAQIVDLPAETAGSPTAGDDSPTESQAG